MIYDLFFGVLFTVFLSCTLLAGAAWGDHRESEGRDGARVIFPVVSIVLFIVFLIIGVRT